MFSKTVFQVPDLSVIIVNYRGWKRLKQCLDSLSLVSQKHLTFEVIIVDNASSDGVLEAFSEQFSSFIFLENSGNKGFANGCNLGTENAKGEYLLFLNPDTVVSEEAILGMLQKARSCKRICIISCRQVRENGSEEKSYGRFLSPFTLTGWMRTLNKIFSGPMERHFVNTAEYISPDWVSGSVVMISKSGFCQLGGWDEDYWMYFEDVDLCKKARNAGGDIIFLKNVTIEHNHGGASRVNPSITALTKTEVFISRHVYISKNEKGVREFAMHSFLIFNNLITGLIPAFLGILFFSNIKLRTYSMIWGRLIAYYLGSALHRTWLSRRSINYWYKR